MLTTKLALSIAAAFTAAADLGTVSADMRAGKSMTLTDGTGAGMANKAFGDTRTLAASGTEALDLAGGLNDPFGAPIIFAKIKAIFIVAAAGNTNDVLVGGAASNGFITPFGAATDKVKVKPGGALVLFAPDANGFAVTSGTGDLLQVTNGGAGTGVSYDIVLVGV